MKTTCFRQFFCPSSGVFHCTYSNGYVIHVCWQLSANLYDIYLLLYVQWKTPDDGQRNCL